MSQNEKAQIPSSYTSREVREQLATILGRVQHGHERLGITRNGKPVAYIVSIEDLSALEELEDLVDGKLALESKREVEENGSTPWLKVKEQFGKIL